MKQELWKDIKGYEGLYQISNLGNIKSLPRNGTILTERVLKSIKHHTGYSVVTLRKQGVKKQFRIHKLVAETFIPDKTTFKSMLDEDRSLIDLDNLKINHKDEDKTNNFADNLEWCTSKYNANYGTRNTKISDNESKEVYQYTLDGKFIKSWKSITEISKVLNIPTGNLSKACNGKYKTAGGYIWRYAEK